MTFRLVKDYEGTPSKHICPLLLEELKTKRLQIQGTFLSQCDLLSSGIKTFIVFPYDLPLTLTI